MSKFLDDKLQEQVDNLEVTINNWELIANNNFIIW